MEEHCAKFKKEKPKYITFQEQNVGKSNFITTCWLSSLREEGCASNKKHSKQIAAKKIYELLIKNYNILNDLI